MYLLRVDSCGFYTFPYISILFYTEIPKISDVSGRDETLEMDTATVA